MKRKTILWITRTAIFVALLTVAQMLSKPLGQFVTGTLVNALLVSSVLLCGLGSAVTVAVAAPTLAFLLGIGPALPLLVPFILLGNVALVLFWQLLAAGKKTPAVFRKWALPALLGAAFLKFLTLYLGIVKLAVPLLLHLPDKQAAVISAGFSYPQLITAIAGGALALLLFHSISHGTAGQTAE